MKYEGSHELERAQLVAANRPHVTAIDGKRDCLRFGLRRGRLDHRRLSLRRAPTRRVRRRVVSAAGTSPSGRNSADSVRARR